MTTPLLREATKADLRFVHSSWHTSFWNTWAKKHVPLAVYSQMMDAFIDGHFPYSRTLVAYFPEVPDEVLGWASINERTSSLHYCYVKSTYRRMGIGRGLVEGRAKFYTQYTDSHGRQFARAVGLQFNPFL
jgi:GNAT superfamily N-acetyltransferase